MCFSLRLDHLCHYLLLCVHLLHTGENRTDHSASGVPPEEDVGEMPSLAEGKDHLLSSAGSVLPNKAQDAVVLLYHVSTLLGLVPYSVLMCSMFTSQSKFVKGFQLKLLCVE